MMPNDEHAWHPVPKSLPADWPFPLVEVIWLDAFILHGWNTVQHRKQDAPMSSVGYLIAIDRKKLVLTNNLCWDPVSRTVERTDCELHVPAGMVISVSVLGDGEQLTFEDARRRAW